MNDPTEIKIKIEGLEEFDRLEILVDKYIELTKNLNQLAALGVDGKVLENIIIAVKPTYKDKN